MASPAHRPEPHSRGNTPLEPPGSSPLIRPKGPPSPIRWAGSKRQLLDHLAPYFLASGAARYVEPFLGSASLFFNLCPAKALLGDINRDLIDAFLAIRDRPIELAGAIHRLPVGKVAYYAIRDSVPLDRPSALARAARFIYLNRFCFNGLYRTSKSGHFNVPYAPRKTGQLPTGPELLPVSAALRHATLVCTTYATVLATCRPGDFVYLDPPYAIANRRVFRQYGPTLFGRVDLNELSRWLRDLDRAGIPFLVSYGYSPEGARLARGWLTRRVYTTRNIAGFACHRRRAVELLISNVAPALVSRGRGKT